MMKEYRSVMKDFLSLYMKKIMREASSYLRKCSEILFTLDKTLRLGSQSCEHKPQAYVKHSSQAKADSSLTRKDLILQVSFSS